MNPFVFSAFKAHLAVALDRTAPPPDPVRPAPTVLALRVEWHEMTGRRVAALPSFAAAEIPPVGSVVRVDTSAGAAWMQRTPAGWVACDPAALEPVDQDGRSALDRLRDPSAWGYEEERPHPAYPERAARIFAGEMLAAVTMTMDARHLANDALAESLGDEARRPLWLRRVGRGLFSIDPAAVEWQARVGTYEGQAFADFAEAVAGIDPSPSTLASGYAGRRSITVRLRSWEPGDEDFADLDFMPEAVAIDGGFREPTDAEVDEQAAAYARAVVEAWFRGRERAALDVVAGRVICPTTAHLERARLLDGLRAYRLVNAPGEPHLRRVQVRHAA